MSRIPMMPKSLDLRTVNSGTKDDPAQRLVESPLMDLLPTFREPLAASFTEVTVPPATDCSAAAGWYPLIDLDVDKSFGQDVMLFSADVDQLSPDVVGDVGNNYLPWGANDPASGGNGTGNGACIVIGTNLPITGKSGWTAATINVAGMNQTGVQQVIRSDRAQYILARPFPVGSYGTSSQVRRTITKSWAPYGYRFPRGSRIQAALVVLGSQIVNATGADQLLRGGASIQLWCGMTRNPSNFGSLT